MQQKPNAPESQIFAPDELLTQPGALDGVTIMRYAHIYRERTSGGVEQYLRYLDRGLLQRHRLTVLQMHMTTTDDANDAIEVEKIGVGRILWVPVPVRHTNFALAGLAKRAGYVFRQSIRQYRAQREEQHSGMLSSLREVLLNGGDHLRYTTAIFSDRLRRLLGTQNIDLLVLHWLSYDTAGFTSRALKAEIPFVFINHFDNTRLSLSQTRKLIARAAAIGSVSGQGIPDDLLNRCVNLSDAVDTEFFAPEKARPIPQPEHPVVLLPARIGESKGHRDLLEAARILIARKIDFTLCFAGAVDSESLHQELLKYVADMGLEQRVLFLGERNGEDIRDWYALSRVVVLPSHSEGLGRVLLEAQAMKKPVVAYDRGGMREALSPNKTGFILETGDVKGLADKISFLLENENEGLRIGERGREFVCSKFSLSALIQRHEAFYLRALSGDRRKRRGSRTERSGYVRGGQAVYGVPSRDPRDAAIEEPLVSILIPAFNAQKWIADTLRSAISQTWQQKEIIVVDDGSADQTLRIAQLFESDRVRVVTQKMQGAAAARNRAFSLCRGDYIQWLDADDLLDPDKIAMQMNARRQYGSNRVLLSSAWGKFIYRHYRAKFIPTALWCDLSPFEWLLRKMGENLFMQTASWLVSRELTEAAGPWDTRLLSDDDGEYFCRVLLVSDGIRFVPEARVYYRGPGLAFGSLSYIGRSTRKLQAHWLSMQLHIGYLRSLEDSERVRQACLNYLRNCQIHFYPERVDILKQAEEIARQLGGQLGTPRLSWKYSWIKTVFGWRLAKGAQHMLLKFRWSAQRLWDYTVFRIEKKGGRLRPGVSQFVARIRGPYQRATARFSARRPFAISTETPLISFTFDDFPRSALLAGGAILQSFGLAGTYYASLGLMGRQAPTGPIFLPEDLEGLLEQGHELGCHTFSHCDAWDTQPSVFEDAIIQNRQVLSELVPEASFKTFSYPISVPRVGTKRRISKYFECCRCGGQTLNVGNVDLNYLSAYFLEKSRDNPEAVKKLIDQNRRDRGWLIFATHDICKDPTPWGCTPSFFEEIVRYAMNSGARILPVFRAYETLRARSAS
jgi:glycosyltransferase involved in cell wall biosynthesis/peptidoglycan/xylan/chitin deacetylase (PgdA/CDA1 family)